MPLPLSFDVVIPSFAPSVELIEALETVERADNVTFRFIIVVDNPRAALDPLRGAVAAASHDVTVLVNSENVGAGMARNRGVEAGDGDFILFLDDDVVPRPDLIQAYVQAINADDKRCPGYVGVVSFPRPSTGFSRGVLCSEILTFFDIALSRERLAWGVTANLCIRRSALGSERFSSSFPKRGGGEDIDLCLRVCARCSGTSFATVPDAVVEHPWWWRGERQYRRFFRWAYGDSRLPGLHPRHRYWGPPTLWEQLLLVAVASPLLPLDLPLVVAGAGLAAEPIVHGIKLRLRGPRPATRDLMEAVVVRLANDLGRLVGHISRLRPAGLLERFDYFCTGESVRCEQTVSMAKFCFVMFVVALWYAL